MNFRLINSNLIRKRFFVGLVLCVVVFIVYLSLNQNVTVCYYEQEWKDGKTLKNVLENLKLRSHDQPKNIFFHETSCSKEGIVTLNSRQACAVESAGICLSLNC